MHRLEGATNCINCSGARAKNTTKFCGLECYREFGRAETDRELSRGLYVCPKCKTEKTNEEFYPYRTSTQGRRKSRWCKACRCQDERRRRASPLIIEARTKKLSTDMRARAHALVQGIAKRCRPSAIEFDLDDDWLTAKLEAGVCEISGIRFDMKITKRRAGPYSPSVDRIVPGGGYTKENCRLVLFSINLALKDFGLEQFIVIAKAVAARSELAWIPG